MRSPGPSCRSFGPRCRRSPASRIPSTPSSREGSNSTAWRPRSEADRRTLIRRLTFDLIGLPPTPEEVAGFLADDRARRLRAAGRSPPGEPASRRELGAALARPRPLRRDPRLRARRPEAQRLDAIATGSSRAFNRDLPYDRFLTWNNSPATRSPTQRTTPATATGMYRARPDRRRAGRPGDGPVRPARRHGQDDRRRPCSG